jgi:single-strand selective monofunctional uracil DNA glycosylase
MTTTISPPATASLLQLTRSFSDQLDRLRFHPPVSHVYNPLQYARAPHEIFLQRFAAAPKRVVFLGMNPGPFGMAQTGIPFGEISAVRDWMGIQAGVQLPRQSHPKRPVTGFDCPRSEVSGRRLWGLFAARFGSAARFFHEHFVLNYCPLAFFDAAGRNLTPDKLPADDKRALLDLCDRHLKSTLELLRPDWLIGVGSFAEQRAMETSRGMEIQVGRILHPSPASPAANRDWPGTAAAQLEQLGVW